jgi:hypothetical protein
MTSLEAQAREMTRMAGLGAPVAGPAGLAPAPLRFHAGSIVLAVAGAAALALGGFFALQPPPDRSLEAGGIVGFFGLVLGGVGAFNLYRRATQRGTLTLYQKGLGLERAGKKQAVLFDEIASLALKEAEHLNNGVRAGLMRQVTLATEAGRIRFADLALNGRPDAVGAVLQAFRTALAESVERRVAAGGALAGAKWVLDGSGFRPRASAPPVPGSMLTEVAVFKEGVSLWSGDDELPFFSVAADSPNALVLRDVVSKRLAGRPQRTRSTEGLGRVLFEKGTSRTLIGVLGLLALGAFATSIPFFMSRELPAAGVVVLVGLLLAWATVHLSLSTLRCHERGIVQRSPLSQRVLKYAEMDRLTYGATRHYHNGVYTGTHISMRFASDSAGKPIQYSATSRGSEQDLELLRDQVSSMIAQRLYDRLSREPEVPWTSARLSKKGVHYRKKKLIGSREETVSRYDQDLRYRIDSGTLHLFVPGEKKSVLDLPCSGNNFYPGFLLFQQLATEAAARPSAKP